MTLLCFCSLLNFVVYRYYNCYAIDVQGICIGYTMESVQYVPVLMCRGEAEGENCQTSGLLRRIFHAFPWCN